MRHEAPRFRWHKAQSAIPPNNSTTPKARISSTIGLCVSIKNDEDGRAALTACHVSRTNNRTVAASWIFCAKFPARTNDMPKLPCRRYCRQKLKARSPSKSATPTRIEIFHIGAVFKRLCAGDRCTGTKRRDARQAPRAILLLAPAECVIRPGVAKDPPVPNPGPYRFRGRLARCRRCLLGSAICFPTAFLGQPGLIDLPHAVRIS
jgi:hypothetical protein